MVAVTIAMSLNNAVSKKKKKKKKKKKNVTDLKIDDISLLTVVFVTF